MELASGAKKKRRNEFETWRKHEGTAGGVTSRNSLLFLLLGPIAAVAIFLELVGPEEISCG